MKSKKMWWLNEESQQVLNRGYLLKGETAQDAIERIVTKASSYYDGKFKEEFSFELPNEAGERHILLIDKKKETPNKYPRKPGTPNKNPL